MLQRHYRDNTPMLELQSSWVSMAYNAELDDDADDLVVKQSDGISPKP